MPTRLIREGWIESEKINQLDASAERFFLRLCLRADDFGRYHSNPLLLRSALFPLHEDIRGTDIPRWLAACEKAGLVRCYETDGKRCLEIPKFGQRMRAAVSRFPAPKVNDGHVPDICLTHDGHVPDRRRPESEAEAEAEDEGRRTLVPAASPRKSEVQKRAEKLFRRRETTPWDAACQKAWKIAGSVITQTDEEDWQLLEWFYGLPSEGTYRRHDLATLLNNWSAEIDRARTFKANGANQTIGRRSSMA